MGGYPAGLPHTQPGESGPESEKQGDLGSRSCTIIQAVCLLLNYLCVMNYIAVLLFYLMQFDWTLLHFAAHHGHLDVVKTLVTVCKFHPDLQTKVQVDCLCVF